MKYSPLTMLISFAIFASFSCNCGGGSSTDTETDTGEEVDKPFQAEWETVVDQLPFPITGEGNIKSITLGREAPYNDNFANRGDVAVYFDQDQEVITIRMRRYTFGRETEKQGTFDKLHLWAYESSGNPKQPGEMDSSKDCTKTAWRDGCTALVYYEGQIQPVRTGADFEVHLPKAYQGKITVNTGDNDEESSYPLRGDVIVTDLRGNADINTNNGNVSIRLSDALTVAPACSSDQNAKCEMEKWVQGCGCDTFGSTDIETRAGNITVDMPNSIWIRADLNNEGQQTLGSEDLCIANVENCNNASCEYLKQSQDRPWERQMQYNYPGEPAPVGAGYSISAVATECESVSFVDGPNDFATGPKEDLRGSTRICTGCLAGL